MLTYIFDSVHYKEVLLRVLHVKHSLWIVGLGQLISKIFISNNLKKQIYGRI